MEIGKMPNTGIRSASLDVASLAENERIMELSFSSEAPYMRWFGNEILSHRSEDVDLSRLKEAGALLFAHGRDSNYGVMPIGTIKEIWLDEKDLKGRAKIQFDTDEKSEQVFQKVKSGAIRGISVGYSVDEWLELRDGAVSEDGRFKGPAWVAVKWQPYEISIEPTPADSGVGVGRSLEENINIYNYYKGENENMANEQEKAGSTATSDTSEATAATTVNTEEAINSERTRVAEITALCKRHGMEAEEYITNGTDINSVRADVLERLARENSPQTPNVQVTGDEGDKFRKAATDGILMRAGVIVEKPFEGARDLRGLALKNLAMECLSRAGISDVHRMGDEELFKRALTEDNALQSILSNAADKSLSQHYNEAPTTFQYWTGTGSVADFKQAEHYRISEAGDLIKNEQNQAINRDTDPKDEKVYKAVATYAISWGFTRQALINDDLSVLSKMPAAYARAAKRGINKLVYKMLDSNPVIYNGDTLFDDAGHGNVGTPGGINTDTLSEARRKMRTQKHIRGLGTINIAPKYLIVPAALETEALQYLNS